MQASFSDLPRSAPTSVAYCLTSPSNQVFGCLPSDTDPSILSRILIHPRLLYIATNERHERTIAVRVSSTSWHTILYAVNILNQAVKTESELTMDGMDMSGMDGMGMDGSSQGIFEPANSHIAKVYWYLIGAAIGIGLIANILSKTIARQRLVVLLLRHAMGL